MKLAGLPIVTLCLAFLLLSNNGSPTNLTSSFRTNRTREALNIIVVVPTTEKSDDYCYSSQPEWERGEEILPGAYIAMSEINASPDQRQLRIIPVIVPQCSITARLDDFVGNMTSKILTSKPIAIVGYFCDKLTRFFSRIADHNPERFGVPQLSATLPRTAPKMNHDNVMFHHMLPSPAFYAKAAILFCENLGWNHIGVISNGLYHDTHFIKMREELLNEAIKFNITVVFQMETNAMHRPSQIISELKRSIAKVVIVLLPPFEVIGILCEANLHGLKWPNYVWLYVEVDSNTLLIRNTNGCAKDIILAEAMEDVLFIHLHTWKQDDTELLYSRNNYSSFQSLYFKKLKASSIVNCLWSNPYASVLYDSVWAIALAVKNANITHITPQLQARQRIITDFARELTMLSFQGASGFVNLSHKEVAAIQLTIDIIQVQQAKPIRIGSYNQYTGRLFVNMSILGNIPNDQLDQVYLLYPHYLTVILIIFLVSSLIFTTITMSLFIHYRKTPEIKATSSILSLCMFLGCYCLIVSSLLHTIASSVVLQSTVVRYASCWSNTFLFTVGLDIVLTTVFTKTLRIYHIFNTFGRVSSLWSDKSLFVVILSVVSIKVLIMVIWGAVDFNHLVDIPTLSIQRSPPYYEVIQKCYSHYLGMWVAIIFGYSVLLCIPMIAAAVLTRRIKGKRSRYKDSKKICTLVGVLFILMCTGNALWFLLRNIGANIASKVIYSLGFTLAALFCQFFLFLPKIIPSIRRHADVLKPTWEHSSLHCSYQDNSPYARCGHQYHRFSDK